MKLSNVRPFLLSACFLLAVALVATLLSGCDGNHIIGDLPTCVDLVTDECVPEVVTEFCPVVVECETCEDDGDSDSLDCDDEDSDRSRKPHKRTRGKGHGNHPADAIDLDSDDPLAGLLSQHCETVCTPDGLGGMTCIQTCYDRTGRRV